MLVIYCSEQLDGMAAAAILLRYARLKNSKMRIGGFLNYTQIEERFQEMEKLKGDLLFILDFSPEQIINLDEKLCRISQNNKIAYWNCHHPYDEKTIGIMMKHVHSLDFSGALKNAAKKESRLCSAEMTCHKFLPNDSLAIELGRIAHDLEFWLRQNEISLKLADLIQSGCDKKQIIEALSKGAFWSDYTEKIRQAYLEKKTKVLNDLMKNLIIRKYVNLNFGFALVSSIISSADAGQKMLDSHSTIDVAAIMFRDGKISFRRREGTDIDLSKIAEIFSGGGHPYAAGGKTDAKNVSLENFEKTIFSIDQKLKDFFINLK
jgi:oligoribonuclease NrnB/cAMP/cGMP phosphodiesterase (DHH superfamily)